MTKGTWGFVAVVVLIIAAGWWYQRSLAVPSARQTAGTASSTAESSTTPSASSLPSGSDSSDAALDMDLKALDAQIDAFASDDAAASDSLSDTPLPQESL